MSTGRQDGTAIQDQMIKLELTEGLQRAIDNNYRRMREIARREWESRFAGDDPSDACVTVRLSPAAIKSPTLPCAGFLSMDQRSPYKAGRRSLAHRTA
jgi:hypothetical protein